MFWFSWKPLVGRLVLTYGELIRGLGLLVFNCSLIPMMVMSIVACYSTQRISDAGAAIRFAGIVCVAGKHVIEAKGASD